MNKLIQRKIIVYYIYFRIVELILILLDFDYVYSYNLYCILYNIILINLNIYTNENLIYTWYINILMIFKR